jgi:hypothetical protein
MRHRETLRRRHAGIMGTALVLAVAAGAGPVMADVDCAAAKQAGIGGSGVQGWRLADGGFAAWSGMNINIDGYARAYHRQNRQAGAVLHLCVGAEVVLPDGSRYHGSSTATTCTGRFMDDLARIEAAGWADPTVGVVHWYGIVADGEVKIAGQKVAGIKPVLQRDGSGFYVSPTSLVDRSITDVADQRRYVNPLRVSSAVVPGGLVRAGVAMGSFGVAIRRDKKIAVPFVVGDGGPRIGEGSPALARQAAGLPMTDDITLANRYAGQVDGKSVLWVFFGGTPAPFDHTQEKQLAGKARSAFESWGGEERLRRCVESLPQP